MKDFERLKEKAIKLRKRGLSYGEIKKRLNTPKSTLSFWLKGVSLTKKQRKKLYTNSIAILTKGPKSQKERRKREVAHILLKAEKEILFPLATQTYMLFGAALYWAEGSKSSGLKITNSDPHLILFMTKWFKKVFGVPPKNLKAWLNIYPQQNDSDIKKFWSELTGIPLQNFGKSFVKPFNKNYKKNNLYYGTISVVVPSGTNIRYKIFGWIQGVLKDINRKTGTTQKEWSRLSEVSRAVNIK